MPRQRRGCGAPARATHADPLRWGTDRGTGHQRGAGERCRPGATRSERSPTDRPPPPDRPPCPHRGGACLTWPDERAGNRALHPRRIPLRTAGDAPRFPATSPAQCGERLPHASAAGAVGRPLVTRTRSGQVMGRCCAGPARAAAGPVSAAHRVRRRVRAGHVTLLVYTVLPAQRGSSRESHPPAGDLSGVSGRPGRPSPGPHPVNALHPRQGERAPGLARERAPARSDGQRPLIVAPPAAAPDPRTSRW